MTCLSVTMDAVEKSWSNGLRVEEKELFRRSLHIADAPKRLSPSQRVGFGLNAVYDRRSGSNHPARGNSRQALLTTLPEEELDSEESVSFDDEDH